MTRKPGTAVGQFSSTGKMPSFSWSIPAQGCITGAKLAKVPGSVCNKCYALKGFYNMPNVKRALEAREQIWRDTPPDRWVDQFVAELELVYKKATPDKKYFRWFDSGDLRSYEMLEQICTIAARTPWLKHWLPTKEFTIMKKAEAQGLGIPSNLVIRISAPMIDGPPVPWYGTTSTVVSSGSTCPAPSQGNKCGSCRTCWSPSAGNVAYAKH